MTRHAAAILALTGLVGACSGQPDHPAPAPVEFTVEVVAENLEVPWDIVFTPDGRMLFTERPGRVRVVENGRLNPEPLFTVPDVQTERGGEIGLMGICLHPDYATNRHVYLAYGHTSGDVRVVRYTETEGDSGRRTLGDEKVIIQGFPAAANHAGCRIAFGPDGKLYITTGEAYHKELAQDMTSLGGKTLRINGDGTIPEDNPFTQDASARHEIWTLGHRNAQGMDWHPGTGLMFQSEHGPSGGDAAGGGDEINIVEAGKNYGWPTIHHRETREGLESPVVEWTPAQAPGSGTFYTGDLFPELKGEFLVGMLRGANLMRIEVSDDGRTVKAVGPLVTGYGRIRDVAESPDGAIYFTTSNRDNRGRPAPTDDRILRLVPKR